MYLTSEEIQKLILDIIPPVIRPAKKMATGPGRLNLHELLEGNKKCWTEETARQAIFKPTFIMACSALIRYSPDITALGFLESLIANNYRVLLWMGNTVPIDDMPFCHSVQEFLQHIPKLKLAPAKDIKEDLVAQNKDPKQYFIVDSPLMRQWLNTPAGDPPSLDSAYTSSKQSYQLTLDTLGRQYASKGVHYDFCDPKEDLAAFITTFSEAFNLSLYNIKKIKQLLPFINQFKNLQSLSLVGIPAALLNELGHLGKTDISHLSLN